MYGSFAAVHPVLFLSEGSAISAFIHSGIFLMGAHQNTVQRAEVCIITMVGALLYGALDAFVCMTVHGFTSFVP